MIDDRWNDEAEQAQFAREQSIWAAQEARKRNSQSSLLIGLGAALALVLLAIFGARADETAFPDKRCDGAGRYEAMSQGADCFNPPIFPRKRPSCWTINAAVHQYGSQYVEALARSKGATDADITREKKRCHLDY